MVAVIIALVVAITIALLVMQRRAASDNAGNGSVEDREIAERIEGLEAQLARERNSPVPDCTMIRSLEATILEQKEYRAARAIINQGDDK